MRHWIAVVFILSLFHPSGRAAVRCDSALQQGAKKEVERINQRYLDFWQHQSQREEREARMQAGVAEVKAQREAHETLVERARSEYRATPKDQAKEEALRIAWEKNQQERRQQVEQSRLCEVQQRDEAEQILKKGRKIPELKEFDLEE